MRNHSNTTTVPQTNDTAGSDDVQYYLFITQVVCYCVISVVGSLANVVICVGLSRGRLKSSEYFILNLSIADLLVCSIGIPLDIYVQYADSWPYGAFLCHVIYPSQTSLILISILTLMGMSLERHRAICSPLKRRLKPKWIRCSIVFIWLIAIAAVIPYAKALKYTDNECMENWSVPDNAKYYTLALFIIDYCIPLTIITYCYTRAGYVLHTKFKKFNRKESTSAKQNMATMKRLQQNKKVIKIFSSAVILFVICVLPGDCYWMWFSFRTIKYHPLDDHLPAFSTIMLYANSAINPFIFGAVQMICHRKMQSRFSVQLTSTTGISRSKGSGTSVGMGEGLNRNSFSRTAVRKHIKYKSLNTRNEVQNAKGDTNLNNTTQVGRETKLKYRDMNNGLRDTNQDFRNTSQELRDTNNTHVTNQEMCDTNHDFRDTKKGRHDTNIEMRDTNQEQCDTNQEQCDTNQEQCDTKQPQRDTNQEVTYAKCTSNETLHDARSISSDSSATLHREEDDTFSMTSETIHNTNCELKQRTESTDCQCCNTNEYIEGNELQEITHKTNGLEQSTFESTKWPEHELNESTENEVDKTENEVDNTENKLQNTKTENGHFQKPGESEKVTSSDFSGSTEYGLNKISNNLLEFFQSSSIKETDI